MAFPGLSVFEGERLSAEAEGRLGVRIGRSSLTLGESTEMELISVDDALHVDMSCGSIRFSTPESERLEVHTGCLCGRLHRCPRKPRSRFLRRRCCRLQLITAACISVSTRNSGNLPEGQTYRIYLDSTDEAEDATISVAPKAGIANKATYLLWERVTPG
jgi:hypothetical protein